MTKSKWFDSRMTTEEELLKLLATTDVCDFEIAPVSDLLRETCKPKSLRPQIILYESSTPAESRSEPGIQSTDTLMDETTRCLTLDMTSNWPIELSLLVTSPRLFAAIEVKGLDVDRQHLSKKAAEVSKSVWEWLIRLQAAGVDVSRQRLSTPVAIGSTISQDSSNRHCFYHFQRPLEPKSASILFDIVREPIETLSDVSEAGLSTERVAFKAGLWQWHDALDESHRCSQSIEGEGRFHTGDYWHAIMHRREPDYSNSKYWFRHVGRHPVFSKLESVIRPVIDSTVPDLSSRLFKQGWDPYGFVDVCSEIARNTHSLWKPIAQSIQEIEMLLLLDHSYRELTGTV